MHIVNSEMLGMLGLFGCMHVPTQLHSMHTVKVKYRDNIVISARFIPHFGILVKMHLEDG
jgi:hypothetical protein